MRRVFATMAMAAAAVFFAGTAQASTIVLTITNTTCSNVSPGFGFFGPCSTGAIFGTGDVVTFAGGVGDVGINFDTNLSNNPGTPGGAFITTSEASVQFPINDPSLPVVTPEELQIVLTQLDFTSPAGNTTLQSALSGTLNSSATQTISLFSGADAGNTGAFVTVTPLLSCSGTGLHACATTTSSTSFVNSGLFSLSQLFTIDLAAAGNVVLGGTTTVSPVPEPASLALLGLGFLGVAVRRRFAA